MSRDLKVALAVLLPVGLADVAAPLLIVPAFHAPGPPGWSCVGVVGGMLLTALLLRDLRNCLPWRLLQASRPFLTTSAQRFVLRYDPQLGGVADAQEVLDQAERVLSELESVFGRLPLSWYNRPVGTVFRRRINLYLFRSVKGVQEVFGKEYGGLALPSLHVIVVPFVGLPLDETVRHELTHLFTHRWNPVAPPLLREGVSTWVQGTFLGYPVHGTAAVLVRQGGFPLGHLLDARFFFREENCRQCYVLAGSFTGFLVRRFGWDSYRRFYGRAGGRFDAKFRKHFGLSLEETERVWREKVLARYKAPGAICEVE